MRSLEARAVEKCWRVSYGRNRADSAVRDLGPRPTVCAASELQSLAEKKKRSLPQFLHPTNQAKGLSGEDQSLC